MASDIPEFSEFNETSEPFGQIAKFHREALSLSIEDLAKVIGKSPGLIAAVESGGIQRPDKALKRLMVRALIGLQNPGELENQLDRMDFKFTLGQAAIVGDRIYLEAADFSGRNTVTEVSLESIAGVSVKQPTLTTMGYVRINIPGVESGNGNTLYFSRGQRRAAEEFADTVSTLADQYKRQRQNQQAPAAPPAQPTPADELIKLKSLLDAGALTQDEFDQAKAAILRKL